MKGRIIGRDGRNIRAFEKLTGVDVIIDETPSAVLLSSFDGVREIARITLERLIADGRIHGDDRGDPRARGGDRGDDRRGGRRRRSRRASTGRSRAPALLGQLRHRTSYGQNVLDHGRVLAPRRADGRELGASVETARRAALGTIGKAVTHEVEDRTRSSAAGSLAGAGNRRRSRTRWRPITARSSRGPSRR